MTPLHPCSLLTEFRFALVFLTRLPLSAPRGEIPPLAEAMRAFPLVGAVVGAVAGLVYLAACQGLPPLPSAVLALAAAVALTGALHEDGLADTADGFGGGATRDDKLRIMRDSRIGSYGVVALILTLTLRAGTLAALSPRGGLCALIAAHTLARAALPLIPRLLPAARSDGLGASAGRPSPRTAAWSLALGILVAALCLPPGPAVAAFLGTGMAAAAVALLAKRQIGGFTGDVLGAAEQAGETASLLSVVVAS